VQDRPNQSAQTNAEGNRHGQRPYSDCHVTGHATNHRYPTPNNAAAPTVG